MGELWKTRSMFGLVKKMSAPQNRRRITDRWINVERHLADVLADGSKHDGAIAGKFY